MTELILDYDERENVGGASRTLELRRSRYNGGDYLIHTSGRSRVRIEQGLESIYSVLRLSSSSFLDFSRTTHHIRRDHLDIFVLWFVRRGSMVFEQSANRHLIQSGHGLITHFSRPFRVQWMVDEDSSFDALSVVVPTHLMGELIGRFGGCGTRFAARHGDPHAALKTFELLFEQGPGMSRSFAESLAREAVGAIEAVVTHDQPRPPSSPGNVHYEKALCWIERNLCNPELSIESVAHGVGISYSYLLRLFKLHGNSFSDVVWKRRIAHARDWLVADAMRHLSVKQIAHMAGFKSASHFNRVFKAENGCTPKQWRQAHRRSEDIESEDSEHSTASMIGAMSHSTH